MCDQCEYLQLTNKGYECFNAECPGKKEAHKPEPNGSVSPSRTRGSLPASSGQIEVEAAAVQLAPVLCPPDPPRYDKPSGDPEGCLSVDCDDCEDRKLCDDHTE